MAELSALEGLIDPKVKNIVDIFLNSQDELFHLKKISKTAKVPLTTTLAITKKLVKLSIIDITLIGKFKLYKLARNKKTDALSKLLK
jgi:DNA-binding IscR family transcriptional regulator|tara:strand:- start:476 stop:736 length:261 start_codon:yes stop_codon:yes gene_type:complete